MSRRRLLLVTGVVAALAVAAAVVLVAFLLGPGSSDGGVPGAAAAQERPGTVLLVPGYGGVNPADLRQLADRLRAAGRRARVLALPGEGTGDLRVQAEALGALISAALAEGAPSVDLVGYSAGGVVARTWVYEHPDAALRDVRRVVTLGSPHHGTALAGLASDLLPGSCPTACQQLAPSSELLSQLNAGDQTPTVGHWVSVWTTQDQVVTPPDSASLDGAVDVPVQSVCADAQVSHGTLISDPLVAGIVLRALAVAPLTAPPPATECASLRSAGD